MVLLIYLNKWPKEMYFYRKHVSINRSPLHVVFKWHHGGNTKNSRTITSLQVWCMNVFREDMKTSSSHNSNLSFNNYDIRWPSVCQCLSVLEARCLHHVIPPPCNPSGCSKCCTLNAHRPCSPWPRLMSQFTAWQFDCTEIYGQHLMFWAILWATTF